MNLASEIEQAKPMAMKYIVSKFRLSREDAEDAFQDACVSLLKSSKPFEGRSLFRTYLTAIVINAVRMQKRKCENAMNRLSVPISQDLAVPAADDPLYDLEIKARREWVLHKIDGLRPIVRSAVLTYYFEHKTVEETARTLGISIAATKARLKRGRDSIRANL